jgi:uncharacterized protein (TIGR00661 family)
MKILYSVQATGNGHISRAIELMPFLKQYGEVDVFLSGSNSNLNPELPIKFRSKGVSLFYGNKGGLDYWKMMKDFSVKRIWREANTLPVDQYDVVLNDFDSITSLACKLKNVPSVGFGHQASFRSNNVPRPLKNDIAGEIVLKHYATSSAYVGLHFKQYDDFIFSPVLKNQILNADVSDKGHITVYLSHYSDELVSKALHQLQGIRFEVFSKKVKQEIIDKNITFIPINNDNFTNSMIGCLGVITGAGFETPAEALYLGKKLLCLPILGQYEQLCNAESLKDFGVSVINKIEEDFYLKIEKWLNDQAPTQLSLTNSTYEIVQHTIDLARSLQTKNTSEQLLSEDDFQVMF